MRNSNIEALRILSMFLIVLHHFSVHGLWTYGESLSFDCSLQLLSFGGKLGVDVFILISGYFMLGKKTRSLSLLRVIFETWFYSYIIFILFSIFDTSATEAFDIKVALLPILSSEYWFVTSYIGMMLLSPFVSFIWNRSSNPTKTKYMIIGFAIFSIIPTLTGYNPWSPNLVWFVWLFMLGGYIREYRDDPSKFKMNNILNPLWIPSKIGATSFTSLSIVFTLGSIVAFEIAIKRLGIESLNSTYFIAANMVPTLFAAIGLLLCFSKLKDRSIPIIDLIAKTTFGIYLIHDNPLMRFWVWSKFELIYDANWYTVLIGGILCASVVFIACSCIDMLRIFLLERPLFDALNRKVRKAFNTIDDWVNVFADYPTSKPAKLDENLKNINDI